jgi:hypothetical protein
VDLYEVMLLFLFPACRCGCSLWFRYRMVFAVWTREDTLMEGVASGWRSRFDVVVSYPVVIYCTFSQAVIAF